MMESFYNRIDKHLPRRRNKKGKLNTFDENQEDTGLITVFLKVVKILPLGFAFLFWHGYFYIASTLHNSGVHISITELSLQEILINGIKPILAILLAIAAVCIQISAWLLGIFGIEPVFENELNPIILIILIEVIVILTVYVCIQTLVSMHKFAKKSATLKIVRVIFVSLIMVQLFAPMTNFAIMLSDNVGITENYLPYRFFQNQPEIFLSYQAPSLTFEKFYFEVDQQNKNNPFVVIDPNCSTPYCHMQFTFDQCSNDICSGKYIKIFETSDWIFLKPSIYEDCTIYYAAITLNEDYQGTKTDLCESIALPKDRVLHIINL
jgi:hypothetical protein